MQNIANYTENITIYSKKYATPKAPARAQQGHTKVGVQLKVEHLTFARSTLTTVLQSK